MAKIIVTHFSPDLDAIGAIWLLRRFDKSFAEAAIEFVPIGTTFRGEVVDGDPEIVHVDTGWGKFDHHQTDKNTCATKLVWEDLGIKDEALERLVAVVNEVDNADDLLWEEGSLDRSEFFLDSVFFGWKQVYPGQDRSYVEWGLVCLDGVYQALKEKVAAEKLLLVGKKFKTRWGEGIAVKTANDTVLDLGERQGYSLVVRQDPKSGHLRIYARADRNVDLTPVYEEFKKRDPEATWFLHSSKCLLLNGSRKDPAMKPTKLDLEEIVEVLEKV